ncbi:hypothetical protein C8J56DRAFT_889999 [Mycena floridula]|nr:hypothetical protein C8J56DRAFT_889999 [Mycena floridula]
MSPRVSFITGAFSGLGRALIDVVLVKEDIAVALVRTHSALQGLSSLHPASHLLIHEQTFGRCDIVFNSAGYAILSEVECTPEDVARSLFEVNIWAIAKISQEAVRVFRDVNLAKVVEWLASWVRDIILPALEGLTEALWKEMGPEWNIKLHLHYDGLWENLVPGMFLMAIVPSSRSIGLGLVVERHVHWNRVTEVDESPTALKLRFFAEDQLGVCARGPRTKVTSSIKGVNNEYEHQQ